MGDRVSEAIRAAIRHAKCRKSPEVDTDDLLAGILQIISRFDIVQIGLLTVDLRDFEEIIKDGFKHGIENSGTQKVTYSHNASALFEKAAWTARKDSSSKVQLVHFLVSFADENNGLMARIKEKYGFSGKEWRAALSNWQYASPEREKIDSKNADDNKPVKNFEEKQFFSPDEAAEFLDVHVQTIRGYIRAGKLPALRLAGERALRIKREDLLALLEPYTSEES